MKFMSAFFVAVLAAISPAAANLRGGEEGERELTYDVHCGQVKGWRVYVPGEVTEYNKDPGRDSNTPGSYARIVNGGSYPKRYFEDYNIMAHSEEWYEDKTRPDGSCGPTGKYGYDFPACAYLKLSKGTLKDGKWEWERLAQMTDKDWPWMLYSDNACNSNNDDIGKVNSDGLCYPSQNIFTNQQYDAYKTPLVRGYYRLVAKLWNDECNGHLTDEDTIYFSIY
jgi:hypothetical protein